MAAVLNNQQITDELHQLKLNLQSMESTLNVTVQSMNESIQQSKNMGTEIDNKLRDHINPLVDAKVIEKLTPLNDNHIALAQSIDARMAAISAEIADAKDVFSDDVGNSKLINDQLSAQLIQVTLKELRTKR